MKEPTDVPYTFPRFDEFVWQLIIDGKATVNCLKCGMSVMVDQIITKHYSSPHEVGERLVCPKDHTLLVKTLLFLNPRKKLDRAVSVHDQDDPRQEEAEARQRAQKEARQKAQKEKYYAEILGLKGKINRSFIKSRYRELIKQYHPDRVGNLGEKLKEVAKQESKKINSLSFVSF